MQDAHWVAPAARRIEAIWRPNAGPQTWLVSCPVYEVFFGGARGGGKTDGMIGDFALHAQTYGKHAKGVFFRREGPQLEEVLARTTSLYVPLGAEWRASKNTWRFPNGATLKLRHLLDVKAAQKYQGHSYTWLCFEELTQWPDPGAPDFLRATLRSGVGVPCYFRATGNPGGPGHGWVKARYVEPARRGLRVIVEPKTGLARVFIPSRLQDNQPLCQNDPTYALRLLEVGSAEMVRAWLEGDWDIVAGGFFDDVWSVQAHVLSPFDVPRSWGWKRSFDWGSAKPASLGLWAVSDGTAVPSLPGKHFPRGSLVRVGELYTVVRDERGIAKANVGQRQDNRQLGQAIARASSGRQWAGCVADPSIWTEAGGKSIYAQLQEGAADLKHSLSFLKADNSRLAGWQKLREMLKAARSPRPESPGLWVVETCRDWLRTVPVLPRDQRNGDDVDSEAEDHAADDTRYAVMAPARSVSMVKVRGL